MLSHEILCTQEAQKYLFFEKLKIKKNRFLCLMGAAKGLKIEKTIDLCSRYNIFRPRQKILKTRFRRAF